MKYLAILISIILFFGSCDKVEGPYYIKPGCTDPLAFNYNSLATIEDSCCYIAGCMNPNATNYDSTACYDDGSCILTNQIIFDTTQKILIEDHTGHTCKNCPEAAEQLDNIINMYPNQVIGMAIHAQLQFAAPEFMSSKFQYDFRTTWGIDMDGFFLNGAGLPVGMVNRIGYSNNHLKGKDEWLGDVQDMLNNSPKFGINIQIEDNIIIVNAKVFESVSDQYKIVICITEDDIINWQKMPDGTENPNYKHKHVLRSILTSSWGGEDLKPSQSYTQDEIITKIYDLNINDLKQENINASNTFIFGNGNAGGWDENNINVVAYIYNTSNWQIEQVEEVHLTP